MVRYSKDANLYVESKCILSERNIPDPIKVRGIYRRQARKLSNVDAREITEQTLTREYDEARQIFEDLVVRVYRILGAKGGVTKDEWDLIIDSICRSTFIFPDMTLNLGTTLQLKISNENNDTDKIIRKILSNKNIEVKIIQLEGGKLLYENERDFFGEMKIEFGIDDNKFKDIEGKLESADYGRTKKRLHYLTIYDFLKFHWGLEDVITKEEFIEKLTKCEDRSVADIISVRELVKKFNGDFWAEYEKYRDFKMIQVLARWYGKSTLRSIDHSVYDFISQNISTDMLEEAMRYLRVHTAFLDPAKSKGTIQGTTASFTFSLQNVRGNIVAVVNEDSYIDDYSKARESQKIIVAEPMDSLEIRDLEFEKTYYVSLWEDFGEGDVIKLGDLPKVTPAIKWPEVKSIKRNSFYDKMYFTIYVGEGDFEYIGCVKKGDRIYSIADCIQIEPKKTGSKLEFEFDELEFGQKYVFCVYVSSKNGTYSRKLIDDSTYTPTISWPEVNQPIKKIPFSNRISFSFDVKEEGNFEYIGCVKRGNRIVSIEDCTRREPVRTGNTLKFEFDELEIGQEYVFCVYVSCKNGRYSHKIIPDFTHIPQKNNFVKIVRLSTEANKSDREISLDFADRSWPLSFGEGEVKFACRSDRFPESPGDMEPGFSIDNLTKNLYENSLFKIKSSENTIYPMIFICGWIEDNLVIHSIIYHILYTFRSKFRSYELQICNIDSLRKNLPDFEIPPLKILCIDSKYNIVFNSDNIILDEDGKFLIKPTGKVKAVVVEAADSSKRGIYLFNNTADIKLRKKFF